ncbi:hypothetical protein KALB_6391 [Kutzneria albida DSM 43870]|uniref:DUF6801 domain-containing protein n=1 Tax=Kutzneria albida DSM 43870 TaxID=1449976 RepID=W5WGP6_9PSEU|nr:hypothetical protein KALB_6391 [Kutzneria albida DSM 43870]
MRPPVSSRPAAVAAFGLAVLLVGAGSAPGLAGKDSTLHYTCQFPATGAVDLAVTVSAAYPDTGRVGQQVAPAAASVRFAVPAEATAELAKLGAVTVDGGTQLATTVAQQGKSTDSAWTAQFAQPVPIPATGELALTASGTTPPVTPAVDGPLTVAAGTLVLNLSLHKAEGSAVLPVPCTPVTGQNTTLATITVGGTETGTPAQPPVVGEQPATPQSTPAAAPLPPNPLHYPLTGSTTIKKLNAVTDLGKGGVDAWYTIGPAPDFDVTLHGKMRLDPVPTSFLNFGFVPATAMMQFVPGMTEMVLHKGKATGTSKTDTRLYEARVNGVGMDLGQTCHNARTITITLESGSNFTVLGGGPVNGVFDLPGFTGCGATEPLDALITGLTTGPGNTANIVLGKPCRPKVPGPDPTCPWQDPDKF